MKKRNTFLSVILLAAACLAFTGCKSILQVPANEVSFTSPYGQLKLKHPHNTAMTNISLTIATNGTVTATIGSLNTVNDPAVIDKTAAGQVALVNAIGQQWANGFKAGGEAAGTATGAIIKTP